MPRIRKNDIVQLIKGKDKGKTGKVLKIFSKTERVLVQGINFAKKHARKSRTDQQGGIQDRENPVHISNLLPYCPRCAKGVKIGFSKLADGSKIRICRTCKEVISEQTS